MESLPQLFLYYSIFCSFLCPGIFAENTEIIVDDNNCTCVPYYQCTDDFDDLVTDGVGMIDVRIITNGTCEGYFDVCCTATKAALTPTTEVPLELFGCGYQNKGLFPWYASLFHQEAKNIPRSYVCGASLIHPRAALTAAHCIGSEGIWSINIGNTFREVSERIVHPKFNRASLYNDIALVILKNPVEISEKINTICLPPPGIVLDNVRCVATSTIRGFDGKGSYVKMLKVPIVPKDLCLKKLRSTRLGPFFQLHSSFMCAGTDKQKNTCRGDGGSPLACPVPGQPERYHQAGIVSWGIGCGDNNVPDVYVKLSMFRDWIDSEMRNNGFEITSYRY